MPANINLGDNYQVDEDSSGNLVIKDSSGNAVLTHTDGGDWSVATGTAFEVSDLIDGADVSHTGELADASDVISDHGNLAGLSDDDHTQYLLVDGTRALTGSLDMGSNPINNITALDNQDYNETVDTSLSTASGTLDIDLSVSNWYEIQADGDVTISFSNVSSTPPGNSIILYFEDADGTGPHTISWPGSVVWDGGTVEDTIPSNSDIEITLRSPDGGTTWRANLVGEDYA